MKCSAGWLLLAVGLLAGVVALAGCVSTKSEETTYNAAGAEQEAAEAANSTTTKPQSNNQTTTTPTTPTTPNASIPTNMPNLPAGRQVPGNSVDASPESDNRDNETMWVGGAAKVNVRCLGNDDKTDGMGDDYFIGEIVTDTESLIMAVNGDGTVTAIAGDFVSPRSGLVYKFKGYTINVSSGRLVTRNPYTLSKSEQNGVFRAYWNTYQP